MSDRYSLATLLRTEAAAALAPHPDEPDDAALDPDGEPELTDEDIDAMFGDWVNSGRGFGDDA